MQISILLSKIEMSVFQVPMSTFQLDISLFQLQVFAFQVKIYVILKITDICLLKEISVFEMQISA